MTMSGGGGGNNSVGQFGDTTLTKVFVGGLAWETPKEALRDHFQKYGDILEAVIISDKLTGRSKGYGFVTFKEAEAAKKAREDATPIINGRRANCNLASLGARRPRGPSSTTPPHPGPNVVVVGPRSGAPNVNGSTAAPAGAMQWYYPAATPVAPSPFHHHHHHHQPHQTAAAVPFYGHSLTFVAANMSYNQKMGYGGGTYVNGHYPHHGYHHHHHLLGQALVGVTNPLMAMYPLYHFQPPQAMGLPAHIYSPTTAAPISPAPPLISNKHISLPSNPPPVCLAVE